MSSEVRKAMTILYKVHNGLYVNLTNRCPCACTFCERQTRDHVSEVNDAPLWLEHEPSVEEVIAEFEKTDVAPYDKPIRINTNGLGDLIWHEDITPKLAGLIDTISISLNTPDAKRYQEIVRSKFGDGSFEAMLKFAKDAKRYVPKVVLSTVETTITREEEAKCQAICDELGVTYRIRPFH